MAEREEKRPEPIVFEVNETGEEYTLEFSRESVRYAERNGFKIEGIDDMPMSGIIDLFFYSLRMHHPRVDRTKAEHILFDILGGLPTGWGERLGELYAAPFKSLVNEDISKNSKVTIKN